jgi:osmoprotectant transport system permease protein
MSAFSTLRRVELPLALPVIIAGVRTALVLIVGTAALASFTGAGGLGQLITTGIKLQQSTTLVVGAILVAALALAIDWLARVVEMVASPKGLK